MPLLARNPDFNHARRLVAGDLLEHAGDGTARHRLTQRDIASDNRHGWEMVHMPLLSLQDDGASRIEHHHLIINQKSLQEIAQG